MMDTDKRAAQLQYDRCLPGLLAFARKDQAEQFAREHGGDVLSFETVVSQLSR